MTIVVETGSGTNALANSYTSMSYSDSYHGLRGRTTWVDGDDDLKEAAKIRATDWVDARLWLGEQLLDTQPLQWPRSNVFNRTTGAAVLGIPSQVQRAVAEVEFSIFSGTFDAAQEQDLAGNITSVSAGTVSVSFASRSDRLFTLVPAVGTAIALLRELTIGGGYGTVPVVRA